MKLAKSNIIQINPNTNTGSIASEKSTELEQFFENTNPILTVITTGYITISTLNRIISYPFSEKAFTLKVFYNKGFLMIKDQNSLTLWNHKFDLENKEEIEFLTIINRGTLLAIDAENQRIWPFGEEKLYKKLNMSLIKNNIDITDENKNKIWSHSFKSHVQDNFHFLEDVELIRL